MAQYQSEVNRQITFQITEKAYMVAVMNRAMQSYRSVFIAFLIVSLGIGLASGSLGLGLFSSVFFTLYTAFLIFMVRRRLRAYYKKTPQLDCENTIQWDEDGIAFRNRLVIAKTAWQNYILYDESADFYYLYSSPVIFTLIPKNAFTSEEQQHAFHMLLDLHVSRKNPRKKAKY